MHFICLKYQKLKILKLRMSPHGDQMMRLMRQRVRVGNARIFGFDAEIQ